jgi:hypothetical protein
MEKENTRCGIGEKKAKKSARLQYSLVIAVENSQTRDPTTSDVDPARSTLCTDETGPPAILPSSNE